MKIDKEKFYQMTLRELVEHMEKNLGLNPEFIIFFEKLVTEIDTLNNMIDEIHLA